MAPFGFIILMHLLLKCYGHTYFYYIRRGSAKITLSCADCALKPVISTSKMYETEPHSAECEVFCDDEDKTLQKKVKSGCYACACPDISEPVYPFKPHPCNVDTYIIAVEEPQLVVQPVLQTQQNVTEASPIHLDCAFNVKPNYDWPYAVYWLKMGDVTSVNMSTCIYFYSGEEDQEDDQYCPVDPDCRIKTAVRPLEPYPRQDSHNVTINSSQLSDSGVYVCVLDMKKNNRRYWAVIHNITVTVMRKDPIRKPQRSLVGLYVTGAIVLIIVLPVILLLVRKKMAANQVRQAQMTQRHGKEKEGDTDPDCSPYAVGFRDADPYSVVQVRAQKDSAVSAPSAPPSAVPELYSVAEFRTRMDSAAGASGQTSDMPDPYSVASLSREV